MSAATAFIHVEQREFLDLREKGFEQASIRLGEHAGRWFFALSHQQRGGDFWGSSSPLGISDGRPRRDYPTRDAALAGAISHARSRWAGRERDMAAHFAWLDRLVPIQPDLFTDHRAAA